MSDKGIHWVTARSGRGRAACGEDSQGMCSDNLSDVTCGKCVYTQLRKEQEFNSYLSRRVSELEDALSGESADLSEIHNRISDALAADFTGASEGEARKRAKQARNRADRVMGVVGGDLAWVKEALENATEFRFGSGMDDYAEVSRTEIDGETVWISRGWKFVERHDDQRDAINRARGLVGGLETSEEDS